jgi:hypothetical protein
MSLVLGGLELQPADKRWRFWLAEGMDNVPEVRGASQVIPFRTGRVQMERFADRRKLVLPGYVRAHNIRAAVDSLKSVLTPLDTEQVLVWVDPMGYAGSRWTNVVVQNVLADVRAGNVRSYSIELEADPFWYSDWGAWTLDEGLHMDEGLFMDEGDVVTITPDSTDYTATFGTGGTGPVTAVRVEVDGASSGTVGVKNDTTDVGFTFPALSADDNLIVASGARTVTLEGTPSRGSLTLNSANKHGEYISLEPGSNTIRVTGQPAEVRIYFDTCWL